MENCDRYLYFRVCLWLACNHVYRHWDVSKNENEYTAFKACIRYPLGASLCSVRSDGGTIAMIFTTLRTFFGRNFVQFKSIGIFLWLCSVVLTLVFWKDFYDIFSLIGLTFVTIAAYVKNPKYVFFESITTSTNSTHFNTINLRC